MLLGNHRAALVVVAEDQTRDPGDSGERVSPLECEIKNQQEHGETPDRGERPLHFVYSVVLGVVFTFRV